LATVSQKSTQTIAKYVLGGAYAINPYNMLAKKAIFLSQKIRPPLPFLIPADG
jgi:hypothetical protein